MVRAAALAGAVTLCITGLTGCSDSGQHDTAVLDSSPTTTAATPAATTGTPSTSPRATTGRKVGLFFGDSDFVGGGCTPDRHQDEAQIAADRLGYRAVIRGAGGTGYASANPDYGLPSYLTQIHQGALDLGKTPSLVVVEGGANDTGRSIDKITRNAESVLRIARAKYPAALLAMVGPMDVRGDYSDTDPVVGALEYAAGQAQVPFIDAEHWIPHDDTTLLCSDYDHPTLKGHRLIGRKLANALRALGA
jgi:lysophospholipase L1-like esterase